MGRPPGGPDRPAEPAGPPPLVGRRREREQLRTAVDGLCSGSGSTVLLEGEPGIGKTRLLQDAVRFAAHRGYVTFSGRGEELERHRPLHAFAGLLSPGSGEPGPPAASEDALVDAALERVADLATRSPVVVVVDDLNWCDDVSMRATAALARRADSEPVLVLGGARPLPRTPALERVCDLLLGPTGRHLPLERLLPEEVGELATVLLGARPGQALAAMLGKAGGNPFYVTQLVRALLDEGAVAVVDGRTECTDTVLPSSIRRLVLRRLTILPDAVQDLLRLAAVLGDPFPIADLEALTGCDALALAGPLADAARAGFLTDWAPEPAMGSDDRLSFRHDLIREALYTDLPAAVRAGLHRRAGEALAAAGAPAPRVAQQLARGANRGEPSADQAVDWLRRAACCPGTPATTAVTLLEQALPLTAPGTDARSTVGAKLLGPLIAAGRSADAANLATDLLPTTGDAALAAQLRGWLVTARMAAGELAGAIRALDQLARSPGADSAVAGFLALGASLRLYTGDVDGALADAERAERAAPGDAQTRCGVLVTRAIALAAQGRVRDGLGHAEQAVDLAERAPGLRVPLNDPWVILGVLLASADRLTDSEAAFRAALHRSEIAHGGPPAPGYYWGLAGNHYFAGRLDDALAEARTGLDLADETGARWGMVTGTVARARVLIHHDDLATAGAELDTALTTEPRSFNEDQLLWVRALKAEATGHTETAAQLAAEAWTLLPGLRYLHGWRVMAADVVRLTAAVDRPTAEAVVADVHRGADLAGPDLPGARGLALRCEGLLTGDAERLRRAAAITGQGSRPLDTAAAWEDAGEALVSHSWQTEAVAALERSRAGYAEHGAVRDRNRVTARLRGLGVRSRPSADPRRPRTGWAALTATERSVVALVADGLTNRQIGERLFISRRTVETHLGHAFAKLGVPNRAGVAALAAGHRDGARTRG